MDLVQHLVELASIAHDSPADQLEVRTRKHSGQTAWSARLYRVDDHGAHFLQQGSADSPQGAVISLRLKLVERVHAMVDQAKSLLETSR